MIAVTTALGERRTPTRTYPDGSFDCPWCGYAIHATALPTQPGWPIEATCPNPACDANPAWSPERLRAHRARTEAARAEAARLASLAREATELAREWAAERAARFEEARFVRHRRACPRAR